MRIKSLTIKRSDLHTVDQDKNVVRRLDSRGDMVFQMCLKTGVITDLNGKILDQVVVTT